MMKEFIMFAHRGASGYEFENSVSSFIRAIQMKAHFIETDVQKTKDNVLVLIHDDNLRKLTFSNRSVSKLNFDQLNNIKLLNGESIPTLENLLELHDGKIKFDLEIKVGNIEKKLIETVKKYDLLDQVVFSNFSLKSLNKIHGIEPKAQLQLLILFPHVIFRKLNMLKKLLDIGITAINPIFPIVTNSLIQNAHAIGLKVYPWTINDRIKLSQLIEMGIDGVFTDYPDILNQENLVPIYV